jgi:hypothetical protein
MFLGTNTEVFVQRPASVKTRLNISLHITPMRVALAAVVALLLLNFMDEQFNDARYTRAAMAMLSRIASSFG